jgi:hypothetical protein
MTLATIAVAFSLMVVVFVLVLLALELASKAGRHTPTVEQRVSREQLETCARIARKHFDRLNKESKP